jgi:stringent starvation protein B
MTTSTRPYLIRALYEWCSDNGLTPYVAVRVDDTVRVPREYVKDGEIVLNISMDATSSLQIGNEYIEFKARFAGVARDILVPVSRVMAIYARENGQGMAFPLEDAPSAEDAGDDAAKPQGEVVTPLKVGAPSAAPVSTSPLAAVPSSAPNGDIPTDPDRPTPPAGGRPALKRVK